MTNKKSGFWVFLVLAGAAILLPQLEFADDLLSNIKKQISSGAPTEAPVLNESTVASNIIPNEESEPQPEVLEIPSKPNPVPAVSLESESQISSDPQIVSNLKNPQIDLLRVEPDGNTLVSGVAKPNSMVELKNGAIVLGKTQADAGGNFVILPDEFLEEGDYRLTVQSKEPGSDQVMVSDQSAIVSIPAKGKEKELLALLTTKEGPSDILSKPEKLIQDQDLPSEVSSELSINENESEPVDLAAITQPVPPVQKDQIASANTETADKSGVLKEEIKAQSFQAFIEAVEIEEDRLFIAGSGTPGAHLNIYLDNNFIGKSRIGAGDRFLFEKQMEVEAGQHKIRIDVLSSLNGAIVSRVEVPFNRQASDSLVAALVQPKKDQPPAKDTLNDLEVTTGKTDLNDLDVEKKSEGQAVSDKVADDIQTTQLEVVETKDSSVIIRRGDTLWHISQRVYGQGIRYTTIYLANQDQIKNPDRIYPGQIFGLPEDKEQNTGAQVLN